MTLKAVFFQVQGHCVAPKNEDVKVRCGRDHHGYLDRQCVIRYACHTVFYDVSLTSPVGAKRGKLSRKRGKLPFISAKFVQFVLRCVLNCRTNEPDVL